MPVSENTFTISRVLESRVFESRVFDYRVLDYRVLFMPSPSSAGSLASVSFLEKPRQRLVANIALKKDLAIFG